jgi:hypothetical protein
MVARERLSLPASQAPRKHLTSYYIDFIVVFSSWEGGGQAMSHRGRQSRQDAAGGLEAHMR